MLLCHCRPWTIPLTWTLKLSLPLLLLPDATVPASNVVSLGRHAAQRSRGYRPLLPLTTRLLPLTSPLTLPPLVCSHSSPRHARGCPCYRCHRWHPYADAPHRCPSAHRSQRRSTCKTQMLSRATPDFAAAPARVVTYALAPVHTPIAILPLLPCKPPRAHSEFCPQAAIFAPPPACFARRRLLPLRDVNWQLC